MTRRVLELTRAHETDAAEVADDTRGVFLGRIVALALPDAVWVEIEPGVPQQRARIAMECSSERLVRAVECQLAAVLMFERGDASRPILLGIIGGNVAEDAGAQPGLVTAADVDGKRVHLRAEQEIILQCGDARISLRRDGRITIRGGYIETNATTTNRIKGGNVRIN